jgi:A/G-specific adenine glycosylase
MSKASEPTSSDAAPKFRGDSARKKSARNSAEKSRNARGPKKHAHAEAAAQRAPLGQELGQDAVRRLHGALLAWYARARRDLPWRRTRDPYAIWLSEVMLQQTRVDTVIPYYERFLSRWPTVHALADAPLDDVLTMWSGLGYYRRARMLHAAAQQVAGDLGGAFPSSAEGLSGIRGIGRYTAGAVASIAFGVRAPLVDGNVARVFARLFAIDDDVRGGDGLGRVWDLAEELVHDVDPGSWNQALMELGATVCTPRDPRCLLCPVREECAARAQSLEHELPRLAPKAKPKREKRWALVASKAEGVLLGRRRADLRFGGMWEPPSIARDADDADAAIARFEALTGARVAKVVRAGEVTHILSHRRLEVVVLRAALKSSRVSPAPAEPHELAGDYDRLELVPEVRLHDKALSTLARKLLHAGK